MPKERQSTLFSSLIIIICLICLPKPALADINQRKITTSTSSASSIDENRRSSLVFIDYLGFRKNAGRVELNVTDIRFSNPNLNFSKIGFFLTRYDHNLNYTSLQCALHTNWTHTLYTLDNSDNFDVLYQGFDQVAAEYNLYFQHCLENAYNEDVSISMVVRSSMYNLDAETGNRCFLSANRVESLFKVYPLFIFIYVSLACLWLYKYVVCNSTKEAPTMQIAFLVALILKAWGFISLVARELYIFYTGCSQCLPSIVLTFTSDFLSAAPFTVFIVLICTGWSSVKPRLLSADKGVVCFVVLANVLVYTFKIIVDQVPHPSRCVDCGYALMDLDIVYFLPLAIALITSIKFLRANEKPSVIVKCMLLFRSLSIAYSLHYYVEAILVMVGIFVSQHSFATVLIKASVDLFLYLYVGYRIKPELYKDRLLPYNKDAEMDASNFLRRYDNGEFTFLFAHMHYRESTLR